MDSNTFICELSKKSQERIKKLVIEYLKSEGFTAEKINQSLSDIMNDRLVHLEEFINIEPFLKEGKVIRISDRKTKK